MEENRNYTDECGDHGGTNRHGDPCGRAAGWGTEFDSGKCKNHRGTSPDGSSHEGNDNAVGHGAPEGNGNAAKHNLHADRGLLYDRLDEGQQARVDRLESALLNRYQEFHGRDPDAADAEDIYEMAIGYVQRRLGRAWLADNADSQTELMTEQMVVGQREDGSPITVEVPARMLDTIDSLRREDRMMRKSKGLENDPESQQAESRHDLADAVREALNS